MEQPTVNENPTVLAVDTRRKVQRLEAFTLAESSVADLAVRHALTEASVASEGKGLMLLKNMGVKFPDSSSSSEAPPFVYAPLRWRLAESGGSTEGKVASAKSDAEEAKSASDDAGDLNPEEVFEIIRNIQDPEHPLTLEQLGVVSREQIVLNEHSGHRKRLEVRFTPTIPHCSMATQIGLCLRVKLDRSLPAAYKTTIKIEPGTHASENAINKQLADKERVCAALENKHLVGIVNRCIMNGMTGNMT
mmetsp:Transcript_55/g.114  ORF Transcript_55/g.114 Transcript_55/m.114 type:complete len:248 (-) Transcript_55:111-854(-)|eukprot:scaffold4097_cov166-Amphora_coffeaeformis.AAC.24